MTLTMRVSMMIFIEEEMELDDFVLRMLVDSSPDEDGPPQWGGSRPGRAPNKACNFAAATAKLQNDDFNGENSVYSEADSERQFCMPRSVYEDVEAIILGNDPFKGWTYSESQESIQG